MGASIQHIKSNRKCILLHILHIRSGGMCGTQHEIFTKRLSVINTVSASELDLMTKL